MNKTNNINTLSIFYFCYEPIWEECNSYGVKQFSYSSP